MAFSGGRELFITIYRDSLRSPWGIRISGGVDFDSALKVSKVTPLQAADGYLNVGDIIMSINGQDARYICHAEAQEFIRAAGSQLSLQILRGALAAPSGPPKQIGVFVSPQKSGKDDENPLPTNANLANMMNSALNVQAQTGTLPKIRPKNYGFLPMQKTAPDGPQRDITSYLPKPQSASHQRRFGSIGSRTSDSHHHQPHSSGHSSPSMVAVDKPASGGASQLVGKWTPPPGASASAQLAHLQYNSPMKLYSAQNVVDSVEKMTGSKVHMQNGPANYYDDIRSSSTYKLVKEIESGNNEKQLNIHYEQSPTQKVMNRHYRIDK